MPSFKGQYEHAVDSKGRIAIPSKLRHALNPEAKGTFTITRGFESMPCLYLIPQDRWEQIMEEEIGARNMYSSQTRKMVRGLLRWADDVELDGQGRIKPPPRLVDFAQIKNDVVIIGAHDRIELWDAEIFEQYLNEETDDYETLVETVMS